VFVQTILSILALTYFRGLLPGSLHKIGFQKLFKTLVASGRSSVFLGPIHIQNTTFNSTTNHYSPENIAFASLGIALITLRGWSDLNTCSVVVGALPLTFWMAVKKFELIALNTRESMNTREGGKIHGRFNKLKMITRLANSIWAPFVICNVIHGALALTWLHSHSEQGNQYWVVSRCILVALVIIGAVIMADGCRVVSYFKV